MSTDALADLNKRLEAEGGKLPLTKTAKDIVPGEGNSDAEVMLIGEAPGHHEAVQRRPFVGRSGQLLRKTLIEVELKPEDVYISNIVKARPPENRDPTPQEIAAYKPFLDEEIIIINPLIIVTLGRFSMQKFLPDVKISQVHGRLHRVTWNGKQLYVLPMYHPAAALRSTTMQLAFITDFKKVPKVIQWIHEQKESKVLKEKVEEMLF